MVISVTNNRTIVRGSGGSDTFQISSDLNTLYGAEGGDAFTGTTNFSTLDGGTGDDNFSLDLSNNNLLLGGIGGDQLYVRRSRQPSFWGRWQ
jgi:Ca2+-binding RTX toxin-like protein